MGRERAARIRMTPELFCVAFKGSPMKRAKLRGLQRNAAVVLGNRLTAEDAQDADDDSALPRALDSREASVREHAAWALDFRDRRGTH